MPANGSVPRVGALLESITLPKINMREPAKATREAPTNARDPSKPPTEMGFSLHAATTASAEDARGREALVRYALRLRRSAT